MTDSEFLSIVGNRAVEDAAIAFVIEYEREQGRLARDTRHRGAPADVESDERVIEVKAAGGSARGADLWLEVRQVEEARTNPDFHVYVVDNVRQGDPRLFGLVDLGGETLARLVARAKEQRYYSVPFPVGVYDANRQPSTRDAKPRQQPEGARVPRESASPGVVSMTRTAAILTVLAHHTGPMRPIEVWEDLQKQGRQGDPKAEVSTTMYDLWQRGRIGRESRGQYYALPTSQQRIPVIRRT